jgi:glutaminyl-peptide cyclotransferase
VRLGVAKWLAVLQDLKRLCGDLRLSADNLLDRGARSAVDVRLGVAKRLAVLQDLKRLCGDLRLSADNLLDRGARSGVNVRLGVAKRLAVLQDLKRLCVNLRLSTACFLSALSVTWLLSASSAAEQAKPVERLRVEVVRSYPHDRAAFTQGLLLDNGVLYESTGLVGRSSLRQVELATGRVIKRIEVPPPVFAEGLALVGDRLYQLSWQNNKAFTYNRRTFARESEFTYQGEGWGLCYNGKELVMSNGSAELIFRKPSDFSIVRTARVTMNGMPLPQLNELECVDGAVYANLWTQDVIVRIDPATGYVIARIEAPNLLSPMERQPDAVLNGIAYDPSDKTFLITGKLWPKLFRVRFVR